MAKQKTVGLLAAGKLLVEFLCYIAPYIHTRRILPRFHQFNMSNGFSWGGGRGEGDEVNNSIGLFSFDIGISLSRGSLTAEMAPLKC